MPQFKSMPMLLIAALISLPRLAFGAQPPNVVDSDLSNNVAMGSEAMLDLQSGGALNTAAGDRALKNMTTGSRNSAFGSLSLIFNLTGNDNTAIGAQSMNRNTTGIDNTATGSYSLYANTTGIWNTAIGSRALGNNSTGGDNTATGFAALDANIDGANNTATGSRAMVANTSGSQNTAFGYAALYNNLTGFRNVALGYQAGHGIKGNDNIVIGANNFGNGAENGVIRIGTKANQKKAFIAGIFGVKTGLTAAKAVFVDSNGQLGTIKSSRSYKEDIQPMGDASERLLSLRPVTFRYKEAYDDGSKPVQFGLIAEEVAEVFPELIVTDGDGAVESVRYELVATLLLNEFQKQQALVRAQGERIAELEKQSNELAALRLEFATMSETIARLDRAGMVAKR